MIELGPMLSVTLAPLAASSGGSIPRAIERAAQAGARAVQLSAAQKGLRPRELDRQSRREVLAILARRGLALGGLDLMIPHSHYLENESQDRAVGAAVATIALAGDLGRVPLSLTLPVERLPIDVADALVAAADGKGVALAIHAEHDLDALEKFVARYDQPGVGAGLDPAMVLTHGHEPGTVASRLADRLVAARLDDLSRGSGNTGRRGLGEGELDVVEYRASLAVARRLRSIVVDLRDLADPWAGLSAALRAWGGGIAGE